jgi:plastocyanin
MKNQHVTAIMEQDYARRRVLKMACVASGTVIAASSRSSATGSAADFADIVLDGQTGGWTGRKPAVIEDESNPVLTLIPGKEYIVYWENIDGAPHNFAVIDEDRNNIVESDIISGEGNSQTFTFTATEEMDRYYCVVHPGQMEGPIEFSSEGFPSESSENAGSEPDTSESDTPEPDTPEPDTPEPDTPEPDTPEPDTPEPDTPEPDTPEPDTPEPEGQGGFGLTAAITALSGAVAHYLRKESGDQ